jgi:2-polyprenyl-6-methoxyphenol hydroxylase-like FAD-dependent oxidoreductase
VRYSTDLVSFMHDDAEVTATLEERATGRSYAVRADYLAACDGAHSHVRQKLGIATQGYGELPEHVIFVYFRAPWQELIAGHESDAFVVKNAEAEGIFLVAAETLGMFLITYRPAPGQPVEEFTEERCHDLLDKAIGKPDLPTEIVEIARWQPAERAWPSSSWRSGCSWSVTRRIPCPPTRSVLTVARRTDPASSPATAMDRLVTGRSCSTSSWRQPRPCARQHWISAGFACLVIACPRW